MGKVILIALGGNAIKQANEKGFLKNNLEIVGKLHNIFQILLRILTQRIA